MNGIHEVVGSIPIGSTKRPRTMRAAIMILPALAALLGLAGAPAAAQDEECPASFQGTADAPLACRCTAAAAADAGAPVWGTDVYSDDSAICRAAVHAGAIGPEGGPVLVTPAPGLSAYPAAARNGVESQAWQEWSRSFTVTRMEPGQAAPVDRDACPLTFADMPEAPLECRCSAVAAAADQPVWGTDVYSDDSGICRAARHAGAIGSAGGRVRVLPEPGSADYRGSGRNGVATLDWTEPHPRSFRVERGE